MSQIHRSVFRIVLALDTTVQIFHTSLGIFAHISNFIFDFYPVFIHINLYLQLL